MVRSLLSFAALAITAIPTYILAAPAPPQSQSWVDQYCPGKYQQCTEENVVVRQDFDQMAPEDRKAYTDAVKCLMDQPSRLDPNLYPGATNRFNDYAAIHVSRTLNVHLDAFFLTWHRMFVWLYEQDLQTTCGYTGTQPYWNWPATASNLKGSPIFDGSAYSMSGDGLYVDSGPIVLSPDFSLPHGSGGGCVTNGPFAYMNTTMAPIDISVITNGQPLPATAFDLNVNCLTRDLNTFVAQNWISETAYEQAIAPGVDAATLNVLLNGVIGQASLGLHSGAHFTLGSPASSLFVSPMDPVWYPLHSMLDRVFTNWQINNPQYATDLVGTMTSLNLPPSANVTLTDYEPDWNYLFPGQLMVGELMSTTAGPFCYRYDDEIIVSRRS